MARMACLGDQYSFESIIKYGRGLWRESCSWTMARRRKSSAISSQPDFELAGVDPHRRHPPVERGQLLVGEAQVDPAGVGLDPWSGRAQRLPQRLAIELGLEVPQRDVERGDRGLVLALHATLEGVVAQSLPQPHHAAGVRADEQRLELGHRRPAAERDAGHPLVGIYVEEGPGATVAAGRPVRVADPAIHREVVRLLPNA